MTQTRRGEAIEPVGCILTGRNRVEGQCDSDHCNYPFCVESKVNVPDTDGEPLGG